MLGCRLLRRDEVVTLEEYVKRLGERSIWVALRRVYDEVSSGKIRLEDPKPPKTLVEFALRLDYSLWFWTAALMAILTIIVVHVTSFLPMLMPLRYFLGTLYVLFLPGYVTVEALYPGERDLKPLERLALSIGLSLAIVPLIGLLLNYTPWGIRLEPVTISLAIYTLSVAVVALVRKYRIVWLSEKVRRAVQRL
jgi:uncharacterized membrane protein